MVGIDWIGKMLSGVGHVGVMANGLDEEGGWGFYCGEREVGIGWDGEEMVETRKEESGVAWHS